jgi:hypothetical protein
MIIIVISSCWPSNRGDSSLRKNKKVLLLVHLEEIIGIIMGMVINGIIDIITGDL